jgi:hypothetical protein
MINSELPAEPGLGDEHIDRIVSEGPQGALTVAGIATAIVVALWLAFYLFVFLPRGTLQ